MEIRYFDIHSHLNFKNFDADREEVIEAMRKEGIATICVGTDVETSKESVALAGLYPDVVRGATVGIHPTDVPSDLEDAISSLALILEEERRRREDGESRAKIVGIGECGLDYYRIDSGDEGAKEAQKELFVSQIELALRFDLPLMLHGRPSVGTMDAYEDMIDVISHYKRQDSKLTGNVHFFAGNVEVARQFLELGFLMSFDGPITFATDFDEVIRFLPLESIMAETDAPFVAPNPHRGKRNSPLHVPFVVKALARIRGEEEEVVREAVVKNALTFFGISAW